MYRHKLHQGTEEKFLFWRTGCGLVTLSHGSRVMCCYWQLIFYASFAIQISKTVNKVFKQQYNDKNHKFIVALLQ